jgi:hypothetical protein
VTVSDLPFVQAANTFVTANRHPPEGFRGASLVNVGPTLRRLRERGEATVDWLYKTKRSCRAYFRPVLFVLFFALAVRPHASSRYPEATCTKQPQFTEMYLQLPRIATRDPEVHAIVFRAYSGVLDIFDSIVGVFGVCSHSLRSSGARKPCTCISVHAAWYFNRTNEWTQVDSATTSEAAAIAMLETTTGTERSSRKLTADRASHGHINTGTGLTPAISAPGLGSPLPHLHRDWVHRLHICTGNGLMDAGAAHEASSDLSRLR